MPIGDPTSGDPDRRLPGTPGGAPFGFCGASFAARAVWRVADLPLPPRSRSTLRRLAARLFPGPFDIEVEGLRFRAYPGDNHDDRVMFCRRRPPDRDERETLGPFLEPGGTFVDVGANVGTYALWAAARVGPAGSVLACEPHPQLRARLAVNVALSGAGQIRIVASAVGGGEGQVELHPSGGGNLGQSSLHRSLAFRPAPGLAVPIRPLAAILRDAGLARPDVLKLDVEGYEDRVLAAYLEDTPDELLPRAVLIETNVGDLWEADCLDLLTRRGYRPVLRTSDNEVLRRDAERGAGG